MELIFSLLQQLSVYLVLAYLLSKTPLFMPITSVSGRLSQRFACYILFSLFCILGTYFGLHIEDAIANTRAIGAVMGGLLGGPVVGFAVGLTGGLHRYSLGGFTDVACAISTTAEGLIGGLMHSYYLRRGQVDQIFKPSVVLGITLVAEIVQMGIILLVADPFSQALQLVSAIALPMVIANSIGAALFMSIIQDRKTIYEKYSAAFSSRALKIAQRSVGILSQGFDEVTTKKIAQIVYEETGVGAVAITDREKILAFIGIGDDHHQPGTPISSGYTRRAIDGCELIYADGYEMPYQCSLHDKCKLGSALVIPLVGGNNEVLGTIKLYEPKRKLFSTVNLTLGEGIAKLLSNQILTGRYIQQQNLLTQAELRLLQAQVNPHFLFNALNTISAVIRRDPDKARRLIQHLSQFFRRNLKQNIETVTLQEELQHVNAYLEIELARFSDRLQVVINVSPELLHHPLPTFTLQPLVENAIKHGTSSLLEDGKITINGYVQDNDMILEVEDNAGNYQETDPLASASTTEPEDKEHGLGMKIVDKRLKNRFGKQYGLTMSYQPQLWTRATIRMPFTHATTPRKENTLHD
ncbi:LytS/YhcK type 5TM receptor domain-containing protein [Photobacterium aphoticum]|uniref:histidine kinase n=1 Tax=Photobacterium aphoticum TaxID=754436 RepID=A0A0J1GHP4_9GAMM|nr:sensor histidine kinase [Photobacterium aphoticum]KLU99023.1 histidine kinase [Photobacterium aphoticum]PSU55638.1 sensor histidine kinase [Photobacterium aphoticum]GHA57472.1 sensor histidine kinase [Photobacterium aphoticum]